jgi:general transcription factor 3C polypeptide 5 (transcription factor C subunit 1)
MGRVENGTIKGTLPDRVAFAVDYPGYPTSVERALQTLGGEEGISKGRTSESNFLELKFRPEDPFAHPAFGELRHTSDLVLRLSKKMVKQSSKTQETSNAVAHNQDVVEPNERYGCSQSWV